MRDPEVRATGAIEPIPVLLAQTREMLNLPIPPPHAVHEADQREPGTKRLLPWGPFSVTFSVGGKEMDKGISRDREGMSTLDIVAKAGVREEPVTSQGTQAGR